MRVWRLALIWRVYLKYCSSLTFVTKNVHWIKLALPAAVGTDLSTHARFRRAPNSGSNFPGVLPPRCASQTSDPQGLRLAAVIRRTYVDVTPACRTTPAPPVTHVLSLFQRLAHGAPPVRAQEKKTDSGVGLDLHATDQRVFK